MTSLAAFHDYTRCPDVFSSVILEQPFDSDEGFFRWESMVLFGRTRGVATAKQASEPLADVDRLVSVDARGLRLPFDPTAVANSLRSERYIDNRLPGEHEGLSIKAGVRKAYYAARPLLPVAVRKHLQRWALSDWRQLQFPRWPVDTTVDALMNAIFWRLLEVHGVEELPFIWFWPDGHTAGAMMTHDVETASGRDFTNTMMKMETEYGIRSSFEVVPEERYDVPEAYLEDIRGAGCEVCLHGLNHDGRLFLTERIFRERARKINEYARQFSAIGFRSPVMYRCVDWFDAFELSYDMSLPNVAHLDPQRGGCCTVMPYFIGKLVELPLTTIQDYPLYNILRQYSLDLWKEQSEILLEHHGLMSFIIHPDYTLSKRTQDLYRRLLEYLGQLRDDRGVWVALPRDVDTWWRQRSNLRLERDGEAWKIVGEGRDRARLAFACKDGERVSYRLADRARAATESNVITASRPFEA
jgi:peptidoglycan/xylan/chitin deacetylase (PgdA/CDA1 family)